MLSRTFEFGELRGVFVVFRLILSVFGLVLGVFDGIPGIVLQFLVNFEYFERFGLVFSVSGLIFERF